MSDQYKYVLTEADMPKAWYNINPDMPVDPAKTAWNAVLHPGTKEPVTPDFLAVLFPMKFIMEAVSMDRWIDIPEPVREIYKLWRPSPLYRARRLEKALDTPAHIYYKYEGVSPVGSHKPNTAIAQAFYAKEEGVKGFTTETGAGQWGSAMSRACNFFDLECHVYMVKVSYNQKPYRRIIMENFGATVTPSPSNKTQYGQKVLAEDPNSPGSLGIAISEAVEAAATSGGKYKYFNELKTYKVRPAPNELPYKFETGTQNHEGIAGVLGALEYLEWLGKQFGAEQAHAWKDSGFTGRRLEPKKGMSAMHAYEFELSKALIKIVESVPGTHIYGVTDMNRLDERVPTVSLTLEGKDPEQLADAIGKENIYVWNGHNYALAIVERLGLLEAGGMIRVGPVHYNTLDELEKFGEVLKKVAK